MMISDRQHLADQRQLTGHRKVRRRATVGQQRHERGRDRDARRRSVLRDRARREVDVEATVLTLGEIESELLGVALQVVQRDPNRLGHHVAQTSGQRQPLAVS